MHVILPLTKGHLYDKDGIVWHLAKLHEIINKSTATCLFKCLDHCA